MVCSLFIDIFFRLGVLSKFVYHQTTLAEAKSDGTLHQDECSRFQTTLYHFHEWLQQSPEVDPPSIQRRLVTTTLQSTCIKLYRFEEHICTLHNKRNRRKRRIFPSRWIQAHINVSEKLKDIKKDIDLIRSYIEQWSDISTRLNSHKDGEQLSEMPSPVHIVQGTHYEPVVLFDSDCQAVPGSIKRPSTPDCGKALSQYCAAHLNREQTCIGISCQSCSDTMIKGVRTSMWPMLRAFQDRGENASSAHRLDEESERSGMQKIVRRPNDWNETTEY